MGIEVPRAPQLSERPTCARQMARVRKLATRGRRLSARRTVGAALVLAVLGVLMFVLAAAVVYAPVSAST